MDFEQTAPARPLWPHQRRALDAFERARKTSESAYIVVPPGGGKTLIGIEAARRLGRPTLILCPNTAIQAQWETATRGLPVPLTILTYQAVWARGEDQILKILRPNGSSLLPEFAGDSPVTLVLDECHHLLETWGRLLKAIIGELRDPFVVGLTATPPHMMTADQKALHDELFGAVDLEVSAPALVRDGHLAPYQELAYFTSPTPAEAGYIGGEALRFAELKAGLLDPEFAATPFTQWLDSRVVERRVVSAGDGAASGARVSWERFERDEPALAAAALRLHSDGLLPLPDGARLREQHRRPPDAEDWVALIGDYARRCLASSEDPRDEQAYEAIRKALPSIGYRLTRTGPRAAESPVDRVLARSEGKAQAAAEILRAEAAELGSRLRALVLTDFAEAGATVPAELAGVLDEGAGGAMLALRVLLADPATAALNPVLMTGQAVACGTEPATRLAQWLGSSGVEISPLADGISAVSGGPGWVPRRYVPLITKFFAEGETRCLVGTRALLGEGWDAPAVNVVVDLTAATTPTSVVQARGRALRLDADWPEKVADNWAVVCLADGHPKGDADYGRFIRKHDRYFALSEAGDIISGVAHVDPGLSPFAAPDAAAVSELNTRMLIRAGARADVRERWNIGEPYADEPVATVTVRAGRSLGLSRDYLPAAVVSSAPAPAPTSGPGAGAVSEVAERGLLRRWRRYRRLMKADEARPSGSLEGMAMAVADGLRSAGLTSRGAEAVLLEPQPDGGYRARLGEVPAGESSAFAAALEDVLSPLAQPRYLVPRLFLPRPATRKEARRLAWRRAWGRPVEATVVYHAVPAVLGVNRRRASAFGLAWSERVSPGQMLYAGSPEGAGILAAQRGDDPFAVTTQIRTLWR